MVVVGEEVPQLSEPGLVGLQLFVLVLHDVGRRRLNRSISSAHWPVQDFVVKTISFSLGTRSASQVAAMMASSVLPRPTESPSMKRACGLGGGP